MEVLRIVLLVFFLTHIPATLLVDSQAGVSARREGQSLPSACAHGLGALRAEAFLRRCRPACVRVFAAPAVLPARYVPAFASRALSWHVDNTGDPLMNHIAPGRPPFAPWFRALICAELTLQLPFFFVASYAFATRRNWIRIPALAYGVHTFTTLLPILAELAASPEVPTREARVALIALYAPYALLPLACAVWMGVSPQPFGAQPAAKPGGAARPRVRKAD